MNVIFPLTGLVTAITLLVYLWMTQQVGKARGRFSIPAPATDGPEEFLRVQRVHGNTIEGLLIFLPALWLFAALYGDVAAAAIGIFYPVGRVVYALGYYQAADKRGRGFMIGAIASLILLLGCLIGSAWGVFATYL